MVFVSNGNLRKSLSVVRSLGRHGIPVCVGEETGMMMAGFSRYCRRRLVYPSPERNQAPFAAWVHNLVCSKAYDVIFPMDEGMIDALFQLDAFDESTSFVLPDPESYQTAVNKGKTAILAQRAGIAQPRFFWPQDNLEFETLAPAVPLPAVIKPCLSSGSRGIRVARTPEELVGLYRQIHARYPRPLIQEYLGNGVRFDVCLLYNRQGELKASFVQKELRHFPLPMGPSTAQESVDFPELRETALRLMQYLPWRGIVELEFMLDPTGGQPKLMEINPRFWNSLEMAVRAGIDFPWLYYQIVQGKDPGPVHEYSAGIRCQNILPGEILHYFANKERRRIDPPIWGGKKHRLYDDVLSWRDFGPALGFGLACLRYLLDAQMWRKLFFR